MPVLDEESTLGANLPSLLAQTHQVIVSDGGSRDRSVEIARELGARVVEGPAGRGRQLNRGAAEADAPILLFVHADTVLPEGATDRVREAIAGGAVGGGWVGG